MTTGVSVDLTLQLILKFLIFAWKDSAHRGSAKGMIKSFVPECNLSITNQVQNFNIMQRSRYYLMNSYYITCLNAMCLNIDKYLFYHCSTVHEDTK